MPISVELAPGIVLGDPATLPVIAGPCMLESGELALGVARRLVEMRDRLGVPLIFKSSYDKANRTSLGSPRGPGLERGLEILARVKEETGLPILTDIHEPSHAQPVSRVADVLQVPAFLCRQTDLLLAAGETGRAVNLKKGQFMAPEDMAQAAAKVFSTGNRRVTVTERGASFGYHNLVVDMRSFAILHDHGLAAVYDVTHSLQLPSSGETTGGQRRFAEPLARAAVAAGADALFVEVHSDPAHALSDGATQLPPERAEALIASLLPIRRALAGSGETAEVSRSPAARPR